MRLLAALRQDIRFQFRHGFYYAYLFVAIMYILFLRTLPRTLKPAVSVLLIFSDTSAVGFFFVAALILLEKDQRLLDFLSITPLRLWEYLAAKILSLATLSTCMGALIMLLGVGPQGITLQFIAGLLLGSALYILIGIAAVSRVSRINTFVFISSLYMIPFFLPLLGYYRIVESPFWLAFPTIPTMRLLGNGLSSLDGTQPLFSFLVLLIWLILAFVWALRWFSRYVVRTGERPL